MTWILVHFKSNLAKEDEDLFFISYEQTSLNRALKHCQRRPTISLLLRGRLWTTEREQMNDGAPRRLLSNGHHDFIHM